MSYTDILFHTLMFHNFQFNKKYSAAHRDHPTSIEQRIVEQQLIAVINVQTKCEGNGITALKNETCVGQFVEVLDVQRDLHVDLVDLVPQNRNPQGTRKHCQH